MVRDLEAMACVLEEIKLKRKAASAILTASVLVPVTGAQARQIARDSGVPLPEESAAPDRGPRVVGLKMRGPDAPCDLLLYNRTSGRKLWEGKATVGKYDLAAKVGFCLSVGLTVEEAEVDCGEDGQPLRPEERDRHRFADLVEHQSLALDLAWAALELPFDELDRRGSEDVPRPPEEAPDTDHALLSAGYVTLTPITFDLTHYPSLNKLSFMEKSVIPI